MKTIRFAGFSRLTAAWAALVLLLAGDGLAAGPAPAEGKVRLDSYGDPLPEGVVRRFGTLRFRNCGAVAFTPDGKEIVVGGGPAGTEVIFWDRRTLKETRRLSAEARVMRLVFSPDGRTLVAMTAAAYANPAWDVASGKVRFRFKGEIGTFTPDNRRLLAIYNGNAGPMIVAWDLATGQQVGDWALPAEARSVGCSPDGKLVAYRLGEALVLHDLATNAELRRLPDTRRPNGPQSPPRFCFSPDGSQLAMASLRGLRLWNVATGREVFAWDRLVDSEVCFSADGKQLAWTGYDARSAPYVWVHVLGRDEPRRLGLPINNLPSLVVFAPDGATVAAISDARVLELHDVATGQEVLPFAAHAGRVFRLELTPDGSHLATYDTFRVLLWDPATGKLRRRFPEDVTSVTQDHRFWIWDIRLAADGQLRRGSAPNRHGHWEETGPAALARLHKLGLKDGNRPALDGFEGTVQDVLETSDGRYLAVRLSAQRPGVIDRFGQVNIRVWDTRTGLPLDHVRPSGGPVFKDGVSSQALGVFSPDNRLLATTSLEGTIHLWDLASGQERLRLHGHLVGSVRSLLFTRDLRFLFSGGDDSQVLQWDLTGRAGDGVWRTVHHEPPQQMDLWNRLADADAQAAHKALWELAADPDGTVAFLRARLKPVAAVDDKETAELLARLDSNSVAAREQAEAMLRKLGEPAIPAMRRAFAQPRSLEQGRRLERILHSLTPPALAGEPLRCFRAIEVLERIATPEARAVLRHLALGLPEALLTRAAGEARERLDAR